MKVLPLCSEHLYYPRVRAVWSSLGPTKPTAAPRGQTILYSALMPIFFGVNCVAGALKTSQSPQGRSVVVNFEHYPSSRSRAAPGGAHLVIDPNLLGRKIYGAVFSDSTAQGAHS
jgi:hypothetical protein